MDIIIFAAISLIIFLRLRSQLGKIPEEEKEKLIKQRKEAEQKIIEIQNHIIDTTNKAIKEIEDQKFQNNEKFLGYLNPQLRNEMVEILNRCNISAEFFINGVKSCFEMVIKAFAEKDFTILKELLSDKIFQGFENAINERIAQEKNLKSNIISIDNVEILSANVSENKAFIAVKITSKQINYFTDKDDKIISGKKNEILEMTDIWTFKKDLSITTPNWLISATS